jgi:hypothetical protein
MHLSRLYTTALLRLPKTPYTMEGFEPGSPVPETTTHYHLFRKVMAAKNDLNL